MYGVFRWYWCWCLAASWPLHLTHLLRAHSVPEKLSTAYKTLELLRWKWKMSTASFHTVRKRTGLFFVLIDWKNGDVCMKISCICIFQRSSLAAILICTDFTVMDWTIRMLMRLFKRSGSQQIWGEKTKSWTSYLCFSTSHITVESTFTLEKHNSRKHNNK